MKIKQLLLIITLMSFGLAKTNAQSYIKINPITLAIGYIGVDYEKVVSDKNSFSLGVGFFTSGSDFGRYTGVGVNGGYRFYLTKDDAPKGLFAGPIAGFSFLSYKYGTVFGGTTADNFSYSVLNIGGIIGYQWLFSDDKFSFELGVGPSFGIAIGKNESFTGSLFGSGVSPAVVLSLGYRLSDK